MNITQTRNDANPIIATEFPEFPQWHLYERTRNYHWNHLWSCRIHNCCLIILVNSAAADDAEKEVSLWRGDLQEKLMVVTSSKTVEHLKQDAVALVMERML